MHPRLEQRLKSGFLALGIGVGSLGLSGCATNNPALNAFMNYGVAPVIAAEAGRGQVIVNAPQIDSRTPEQKENYRKTQEWIARDYKERKEKGLLTPFEKKREYDTMVELNKVRIRSGLHPFPLPQYP